MKTSTMDANVNEKGPTGHHGTTGFADSTVPSGADKRTSVTTTTTTLPQNVQSSQFNQQQGSSFGNQSQQTQRRESQVNLLWRRAKEGFQQLKRKVEDYSSDVPVSKYAIPLLLLAVFLALWANGSMQGLKDKLVPSSSTFSAKNIVQPQFTQTQQAPPQQVCFPIPNTNTAQNMMPNTGSIKDYVPDSNTFKNMMPNTGNVKDYVPDSNTVKNMMPNSKDYIPDSNTVKNMMPNSKDYIPDSNTVKNMMPNTDAVKDSVRNMMPDTGAVKDTVKEYIPNSDTVKNMMPNADSVKNVLPNADTFKNMMPHSSQPDTKTQHIKTEIVQEFQVPNQAINQQGTKQVHEQKTFDSSGSDSSSTFSEKLSQAGEAIKSSYERVKEKVAGSGNE